MKKIFICFLTLCFCFSLWAQERVYLWPQKKGPGSEKLKIQETVQERQAAQGHKNRAIMAVTEPYFDVYRPKENANGKGILMMPGGAYQRVVYDKEGTDLVGEYNKAGYTCFILVYRTPNDDHKKKELVPLQDAQRAMRVINAHAKDFGVEKGKTGVFGASAGGHLAASLSTRYAEVVYKMQDDIDMDENKNWTDCRPFFSILLYPVITMQEGLTHAGSCTQLLGEKPKKEQRDAASCELLVTKDTPPSLICCATTDKSVDPMSNAIAYWKSLKEQKCNVELHIFPESGHGFGIVDAMKTAQQWQKLSIDFLLAYAK